MQKSFTISITAMNFSKGIVKQFQNKTQSANEVFWQNRKQVIKQNKAVSKKEQKAFTIP